MTDYTELKRLAEHHRSLGHAYTVATPSAVLALIAENERLRNLPTRNVLLRDREKLIDQRNELKAEVAGLKTGYQAYERVNAELKAEVERLDNALSVTDTAAQKWLEERTDPQAALAEARELFGSILDNPRLVLGMPSALLVGIKDFLSNQSGRAGKGKGEQP